MHFNEYVAPRANNDDIPYVWSGGADSYPARPARPCIEHGEIACDKHMSSSYPETRRGLIGYRIWAGIVTVVPTASVGAAVTATVLEYGVWVVYAPIIVFFALVALYGIGWGSTACYRLAKK